MPSFRYAYAYVISAKSSNFAHAQCGVRRAVRRTPYLRVSLVPATYPSPTLQQPHNASPHRNRDPDPLLEIGKLHGSLDQEPHCSTRYEPVHRPDAHELPTREPKPCLLLLRVPRKPLYMCRAREPAFRRNVFRYVVGSSAGVRVILNVVG